MITRNQQRLIENVQECMESIEGLETIGISESGNIIRAHYRHTMDEQNSIFIVARVEVTADQYDRPDAALTIEKHVITMRGHAYTFEPGAIGRLYHGDFVATMIRSFMFHFDKSE